MAFPQGIDFRGTSGFVTDPAGCDPEIGTTANYPRTTAQGNTVGWEQVPTGTADRTSTVDPRCAGIAFQAHNGGLLNYRIDLPAPGQYLLRVAIGDNVNAQTHQIVKVFDGATDLGFIVNDQATTFAGFFDATGTLFSSAANWVTGNTPQQFTFATTICRIRLGGNSGAVDSDVIAHVFVSTVQNFRSFRPIPFLPKGQRSG